MPASITSMSVTESAIAGLWIITTKAVSDGRGTVREFFRTSAFSELGLDVPERWNQVNLTWTVRGGLRGLHGEAMTKLVGVAYGEATAACVDARPDSTTFGKVVTVALEVGTQMLVPPGVCNGFQAVSEPGCQYLYCFDAEWTPDIAGVAVNALDPALGIDWPIRVDATNPDQVSAKDAAAPLFADL